MYKLNKINKSDIEQMTKDKKCKISKISKNQYSILSNKAILRHMKEGEIVIYPFNIQNLNTSSYDVTLGEYYFRENFDKENSVTNIYNIYSETDVKKLWGEPLKAKPYSYYLEKGIFLENVFEDDKIIFINPGERILGHTNEFIGGKTTVTTMMKARSSSGRNFISVCLCAGLGDIGYFNRWTMEITNNSNYYRIPLIVNRRYAQILFMNTEGLKDDDVNCLYNKTGKYQTLEDLSELENNWSPYDMLPKMYLDREITKFKL